MTKFNFIVFISPELAETVVATLARNGIQFMFEKADQDYAISLIKLADFELVKAIKNFDPTTEVFEGQQYVVVNCGLLGSASFDEEKYPGELFVMGDEPSTYGLLRNAASLVEDAIADGHDLESVQVFQLIPVPLGWTEAALKLVIEGEEK